MYRQIFKILIAVLLLVSITACNRNLQAVPNQEQPVSSSDPTPTVFVPDSETYALGENAIVEEIQVHFLESWPLQVSATLQGHFGDGCTAIYETEAVREGQVFHITLRTARPKDAMCTQALEPFKVNVPLDVYGLPAGVYTINAYGASTEFEFEVDNVLDNSGN